MVKKQYIFKLPSSRTAQAPERPELIDSGALYLYIFMYMFNFDDIYLCVTKIYFVSSLIKRYFYLLIKYSTN